MKAKKPFHVRVKLFILLIPFYTYAQPNVLSDTNLKKKHFGISIGILTSTLTANKKDHNYDVRINSISMRPLIKTGASIGLSFFYELTKPLQIETGLRFSYWSAGMKSSDKILTTQNILTCLSAEIPLYLRLRISSISCKRPLFISGGVGYNQTPISTNTVKTQFNTIRNTNIDYQHSGYIQFGISREIEILKKKSIVSLEYNNDFAFVNNRDIDYLFYSSKLNVHYNQLLLKLIYKI